MIEPQTETLLLPLGDTTLTFTKRTYATPQLFVFLQLHDNEVTAEEAAMKYLQKNNGVLLSIENGGERNVSFSFQGRRYTFDPNRMFTPDGIQATLERLGSSSPEAIAAVDGLAKALLKELSDTLILVALHNNTDAAFSALSYRDDSVYQKDVAAVHIEKGKDEDDFFLTTDAALYKALAAQGYNTVLQDNSAAADDGSLSVYYGKKGVRYVNIEAQHGHRTVQVKMIQALVQAMR